MSLYNLPAGAIAAVSSSTTGVSTTPSPQTMNPFEVMDLQPLGQQGLQPLQTTNFPPLSVTNGPQTLTAPIAQGVEPLGTNGLQGLSLSGVQGGGDDQISEIMGEEPATRVPSSNADTRIRLRAMRGREEQVYGSIDPSNILSILHETDGLLFPYTPTISVSQATDYQSMNLVHTNSDSFSYTKTPSTTISLSAKFTVQNQREGQYLLSVLHLLRVVSKMYFGEADKAAGKAGLPPPIMIFNGYGNYMFNELPVIVKGHSYSLDDSADTVVVNTAGGVARLPSLLTISIDLVVQQSPMRQRKEFSLDSFRTGELLRTNGGWI